MNEALSTAKMTYLNPLNIIGFRAEVVTLQQLLGFFTLLGAKGQGQAVTHHEIFTRDSSDNAKLLASSVDLGSITTPSTFGCFRWCLEFSNCTSLNIKKAGPEGMVHCEALSATSEDLQQVTGWQHYR